MVDMCETSCLIVHLSKNRKTWQSVLQILLKVQHINFALFKTKVNCLL